MPLSESDQFVVDRPSASVHAAVLERLASWGAKVDAADATHIEAKTGSQLAFRLKGGLLAKEREFPMRAAVDLAPQGNSTRVDVTVTDSMGIGTKTGIKKKYGTAIQGLLSDIRDAAQRAA
jgi:hypothetical protein